MLKQPALCLKCGCRNGSTLSAGECEVQTARGAIAVLEGGLVLALLEVEPGAVFDFIGLNRLLVGVLEPGVLVVGCVEVFGVIPFSKAVEDFVVSCISASEVQGQAGIAAGCGDFVGTGLPHTESVDVQLLSVVDVDNCVLVRLLAGVGVLADIV